MKNEAEPLGYRSILRNILIEKQEKNPRFSLRRFAETIGIGPSYLSMVLSGKRALSEESGALITEKLNLSESDSKKIILLIRLEKATTASHRERILKELAITDPNTAGKRDLAVDQFKAIADWYHLPLQILIEMEGFKWSVQAAAKMLGISTHEVTEALERLTALELIEWDSKNQPRRTKERVFVSSPFKNEALKKHHTQMLEKTISALSEQTPDVRFTGTVNFALTEAQLKDAHEILKETLKKLSALSQQKGKKHKLYHTNLNLISLATGESK